MLVNCESNAECPKSISLIDGVIIDVPEITLLSGICVIEILYDKDFVGDFYLKFFSKSD